MIAFDCNVFSRCTKMSAQSTQISPLHGSQIISFHPALLPLVVTQSHPPVGCCMKPLFSMLTWGTFPINTGPSVPHFA